jgi:hypothetical protein
MKKYIFTESQIKSVINTTISEQTNEMNLKKAVQCFLNKLYGTNIKVDGYHGDATENLISKLQSSKKVYPVDGVWGPDTVSKLNPKERELFDDCISEYGDIIDKGIHGLKQVGKKISNMF